MSTIDPTLKQRPSVSGATANYLSYYVATSFVCDRETCELGEDFPELKKIERAYRLLEQRLERAALRMQATRALRSAQQLANGLSDVRHDASFGSTLSLAEDAFVEARVVKVKSAALSATSHRPR